MIENVTAPVVKEQLEVVGQKCTCDICKKKIFEYRDLENKNYLSPRHYPHPKHIQWFTVTTGHYDWENDSGDSVETFEVCSYKCLHEMLDKYLGTAWASPSSATFHNTEYFNCEHKSIEFPEEWNVE